MGLKLYFCRLKLIFLKNIFKKNKKTVEIFGVMRPIRPYLIMNFKKNSQAWHLL